MPSRRDNQIGESTLMTAIEHDALRPLLADSAARWFPKAHSQSRSRPDPDAGPSRKRT